MATIQFNGKTIELQAGQSVLAALLKQGLDIPHSCQAGACQTCLMQATRGKPPAAAQQGLKPSQAAQGYFLACCCEPDNNLEIRLAGDEQRQRARVVAKQLLSNDVLQLRLQTETTFHYRAGQYTTLWANGIGRSYSLASVPGADQHLELQIRRIEGGQLSPWLFEGLSPGDEVHLQEATGNCFYMDDDRARPLLMVGTGTGLAPLYGIVRDALRQGHQGAIHLVHGSPIPDGLYLHQRLRELEQRYGNFHYHACVLHQPESDADMIQADIGQLATDLVSRAGDWRYYLCGNPGMVEGLKKSFFLAGASMKEIYSDPFIQSPAA